MNHWNSFDRIESVKLEVPSVECFGESAVAREIFLLNLKLGRPAGSIVHVVCSIDRGSYIQAVLWVFIAFLCNMKLCFLLISRVFKVRVNSFTLKLFLNNFAFDEPLSLFEVIHGFDDLGVGWYFGFFQIDRFCANTILHPWGSILVIGSIIETIFGIASKGAAGLIVGHDLFLQLKNIIDHINSRKKFIASTLFILFRQIVIIG